MRRPLRLDPGHSPRSTRGDLRMIGLGAGIIGTTTGGAITERVVGCVGVGTGLSALCTMA
jgi:hypothetical protein